MSSSPSRKDPKAEGFASSRERSCFILFNYFTKSAFYVPLEQAVSVAALLTTSNRPSKCLVAMLRLTFVSVLERATKVPGHLATYKLTASRDVHDDDDDDETTKAPKTTAAKAPKKVASKAPTVSTPRDLGKKKIQELANLVKTLVFDKAAKVINAAAARKAASSELDDNILADVVAIATELRPFVRPRAADATPEPHEVVNVILKANAATAGHKLFKKPLTLCPGVTTGNMRPLRVNPGILKFVVRDQGLARAAGVSADDQKLLKAVVRDGVGLEPKTHPGNTLHTVFAPETVHRQETLLNYANYAVLFDSCDATVRAELVRVKAVKKPSVPSSVEEPLTTVIDGTNQ